MRRVDVGSKQGVYCFRLHRQFGPNFDIAYREPSDQLIPIPTHFLNQINDREVDSASVWANDVFQGWLRKRQNPTQGDLLEEEKDEE